MAKNSGVKTSRRPCIRGLNPGSRFQNSNGELSMFTPFFRWISDPMMNRTRLDDKNRCVAIFSHRSESFYGIFSLVRSLDVGSSLISLGGLVVCSNYACLAFIQACIVL